MNDCGRYERLVEAYLADEISHSQVGALRRHCQTCEDCRRLVELDVDLKEMGPKLLDPDPDELRALRESVMSRIGSSRNAPSLWESVQTWLLRPIPALLAAGLLLAGGVWAGRTSVFSAPGLDDQIVRSLSDEARSNRRLADLEDSAFTFSNVTFRQIEGGRVSLSFDVSTHLDLIQPVDSPLVKEVLAGALLNPSHVGSRLKAVSFAGEFRDDKVKEALVFSMLHDANLAVRLRALSILTSYPKDEQVEAAMLSALRDDNAVQMRLLALDYLAGHDVDMGLIRRTIEESPRESDPTILLRTADYDR